MSELNENSRLETFCDGVIAIAITLLILEIKIPPIEAVHSQADLWLAVSRLWPSFFAFLLSFAIILISWVGHHAMFTQIKGSSPHFMFGNGFFLLTVVVLPFPTGMMAEYLRSDFAQPAIIMYCLANLFHNIGWNVLFESALSPVNLAKNEEANRELPERRKGARFGFVINCLMLLIAFWFPYAALVLTTVVWIYWVYASLALRADSKKTD